VGTNHPVAEVQLVAVVTASLRQYQVLVTSLDAGATIQAVPPLRQIKYPPRTGSPSDAVCTNVDTYSFSCQFVGPTIIAAIVLIRSISIYCIFQ